MEHPASNNKPQLSTHGRAWPVVLRSAIWVLLIVAAGLVYGLTSKHVEPFTANQNTKMVHGMALLGVGHLEHDWLANTTNPFPVWAVVVAVVYGLFGEYGFYAGTFLVGGLYMVGLTALAMALRGWPRATNRWQQAACVVVVFSVSVLAYSVWLRAVVASGTGPQNGATVVESPEPSGPTHEPSKAVAAKSTGLAPEPGKAVAARPIGWLPVSVSKKEIKEIIKYWSNGVASQGVMSAEFQPAMFGTLVILGLAAFVYRRDMLGAGLIASGPLLHPTYLITSVAMMAGILLVLALPGLRGPPHGIGSNADPDDALDQPATARPGWHLLKVALVFLVPTAAMLFYTWWSFGATSTAHKLQGDAILAEFRIPHHALPEHWLFADGEGVLGFQPEVALKTVLIVLAPLLAWRWRLALPILVVTLVGVLLVWITVAWDSHRLMLIAPWRVSAVLVPIAMALLIGRLTQAWYWMWYGLSGLLWAKARPIVRYGVVPTAHLVLVGYAMWFGWERLSQTVDRYASRPDWAMYQWVRESSGPDDVYLVAAQWRDFRLKGQTPVVVTHKSHPIKDIEVLDWKARIDAVYAFEDAESSEEIEATVDHLVRAYGVTRVALRSPSSVQARWLKRSHRVLYEDGRYLIVDATPLPGPEPGVTEP